MINRAVHFETISSSQCRAGGKARSFARLSPGLCNTPMRGVDPAKANFVFNRNNRLAYLLLSRMFGLYAHVCSEAKRGGHSFRVCCHLWVLGCQPLVCNFRLSAVR